MAAFFMKIRTIVCFYKEYSKTKVAEFKRTKVELSNQLFQALIALQVNLLNGRLQLEVVFAKGKLANIERHKINGIKVRSRMRWKDKGD